MRRVVLVLALGTLAACGSKETEQPKGSSFGQVLPGSASDAMLPYDTVTSAPPLEAPTYDVPESSRGDAPRGEDEGETVPEALAT
ncbi:putative lipoprotein [Novosphingobium chloroacetimidivorans]|uniref:Putative lipoprotein n=1 Tax=Novosphingobium chloroacetimidivorans TaxID=1428314 RepID=A0A7W7K7B0_9SPHN|nr:hypothetical protein [Novosphingobium chloroacetimidivorans]MBB4857280.1 putative lipoprotein [Novosphingobium chloroacetimidivorans]